MALALGMTRRELLSRLDPWEFEAWKAYFAQDPFGQQREDMRFAMLAKVMADLAGARDVQMKRFMLYPEHRVTVMTNDQMIANAKMLAGWFSGNHHRKS